MKVGIIILCRYDSSRLPGKILRKIADKPILAYIYERLRLCADPTEITVATSVEPSDDPIYRYCCDLNIQCFRGSKEDVSERFLLCSESNKFDYAIRINGDNLFADTNVISSMIKIARGGQYDFISNVKGRTFPIGQSVEIVKSSFYRDIYSMMTSSESREHVTLYLYQNENLGKRYYYQNESLPEARRLKLAIDDKDDFDRAQGIINRMKEVHTRYNLREILELLPNQERVYV